MKPLLFLLTLVAIALGADKRPNIVIFLADDQGWGDLSVNGNTGCKTPAIDSLARDGASLDRFFVCSVCAPTRAEFLTGRYHPRTGVRGVSSGQERLNTDERTLADALRAAGYATGAFGKWHNGSQWPYHPNARGFAEYTGFTSGHWGEYFDAPLEHNGQPIRGAGYIADDLTTRALDFITRHRDGPFLCYVPFNIPHSPWAVPDADWQRFKDAPIAQRGGAGEDADTTRCALAMTEALDRNVGRVLRHLDELALRENTIVIYFSDNGPNTARWNGGMKGRKGSVDEGGVRSPCFIRWPGKIAPGAKIPHIAGAIDLLPTLCALTSVPRVGDKPIDGLDLSPLLLGTAREWPERFIFSMQNGRASVRSQTHRLDAAGAFFDMVKDPGQSAAITEPAIAAPLTKALADWRATLPVALDTRPFPVGYREFPRTWLPSRDATAKGGIQRSASAPNCSYFVNWKTKDGAISWDTEIATTGEYAIELHYTCPLTDVGSRIELSCGAARRAGIVTPGWDPPLFTNQDTIPRPAAESRMKEFRVLPLGVVRLEKGRAPLVLRALEIPGTSVMDLRGVVLTLQP